MAFRLLNHGFCTSTRWLGAVLALVSVGAFSARGDREAVRSGNATQYDEQVRPFLVRHCGECHAGTSPKGKFYLDRLKPEFGETASRARWESILEQIKTGAMPPKSKSRPAAKEAQIVARWIDHGLASARSAGRVVLRRLNRAEYENTIRDLLGVRIDLKDLLPPDESSAGFDNVGEALHISSFLLERYLEAADLALKVAIANGPAPKAIKKRYSLRDQHHVKVSTESVYRKIDNTVVLFSSSPWNAVWLYEFYPPDRGAYRFRISNSAFQSAGKPVTFRITAGGPGLATPNQQYHLIGYFDAPAGKPAVLEFVDNLEARNTITILPYGSQWMPYGLATAQAVNKIGADKYGGPGLAVQWLEVEGPLHESWPPRSHRLIFGAQPQGPAPIRDHPKRVEVVSKSPEADAERILRAFARRAFRRTATDEDIKPYLELTKSKLAAKYSFEQAVRVGLLAVLVSPDFLFLRERSADSGAASTNRLLDDFALASRLSYFLWSSMPDEQLLTLAEQNKLARPETLRRQVERMLHDSKAASFTENFVGQWLNLRDIDFTQPSILLYPDFDDMLKASMIRETELFFTEVLKNNLSLTDFLASDWAMLNGRLAKHYGIAGLDGWEFRKVKLLPGSHRGGVLTMASVLKVTANGTTTSPVTRGAWVLERILGTPPPRPPADVNTALEPDLRGTTTIREQLAKHRQVASCATCHTKIDPPGFALESFDVIGGWREHYRTTGNGKSVDVDGRRMPYRLGRKVDPGDVLPDGRRFRDVDEFKQLLLANKDQFTRALTQRLVTYATGAPATVADGQIEAIVARVRNANYGFRTLIQEIVQSELFRRK
jgi:hypothetical protein